MWLETLRHYIWLAPIVLFVAWLIGTLYIYAPHKVRRTQLRDREPGYEPANESQIPQELAEAFALTGEQFRANGFEFLGYVAHRIGISNKGSFVAVWSQRSRRDSAQVIVVRTPNRVTGGLNVTTLVTYRTDFTDGTYITTSNTRSPSIFPVDPKGDSVICPDMWDLSLLYAVHRARIGADSAGRTATLWRVTGAVDVLKREHHEMYERLLANGFYALDATGQKYQLTLKGAHLSCYRLLPPLKQIRLAQRRRKADRVLKAIGFGSLEELSRTQKRSPSVSPTTPEDRSP